jgi:hypothetical protein
MNGNVIAWYLKECLLKGKQIPTHVSDPQKKPTIKGKTKPPHSHEVPVSTCAIASRR